MTATQSKGLEGVVAAQTRLSHVDGERGELIVAGYPLDELAPRASFEELLFLLWNDRRPDEGERQRLAAALAARRSLPAATLALLRAAAAQRLSPMEALELATPSLRLAGGGEDARGAALRLVAALPIIVGAYWRLLHGQEPIPPQPTLGHAASYLHALTGEQPGPEKSRALESYLNTVADHGLNASTFAARVVASTASDVLSAVTAALGALKGPLHGGAPGPALDMVFAIRDGADADRFLRDKLERGERLMGFGHRVYKVRDPRADVLAEAAQRFYRDGGDAALYALALDVERRALALLEEYKPGRRLQTNVEFYTALLLHGLGLPSELFTPTFALARVAGWTAHFFEQQANGRILRPQSEYVGAWGRRW